MPYNYGEVSDLYKKLGGHELGFSTLPEFAGALNKVTGTQDYDAGLHDNFIKQASHGLDKLLSPVADVTEPIMGVVGSMFGQEEVGRKVGRGLPRMAANLAPLAAGPFGVAAAAGLSGAQTYTETGSPLAGAISAGTVGLLPTVGGYAGQLGAKLAGAPLVEGVLKEGAELGGKTAGESISTYVPTTKAQQLAAYVGSQVGGTALFEASGQAQSLAQGQGLYNPVTKDHVAETLISMLAFAPHDLPALMKAPPTAAQLGSLVGPKGVPSVEKDAFNGAPEVNQKFKPTSSPDKILELVTLKGNMEGLQEKMKAVEADGALSTEDKAAQLGVLQAEFKQTLTQTSKAPKEVFAETQGNRPLSKGPSTDFLGSLEWSTQKADLVDFGPDHPTHPGKWWMPQSMVEYSQSQAHPNGGMLVKGKVPTRFLQQAKELSSMPERVDRPMPKPEMTPHEQLLEELRGTMEHVQSIEQAGLDIDEVMAKNAPTKLEEALFMFERIDAIKALVGIDTPITNVDISNAMQDVMQDGDTTSQIVKKATQKLATDAKEALKLSGKLAQSDVVKLDAQNKFITEKVAIAENSAHPESAETKANLDLLFSKTGKIGSVGANDNQGRMGDFAQVAIQTYLNWDKARAEGKKVGSLAGWLEKSKERLRSSKVLETRTYKEDGTFETNSGRIHRFESREAAEKLLDVNKELDPDVFGNAEVVKHGDKFIIADKTKEVKGFSSDKWDAALIEDEQTLTPDKALITEEEKKSAREEAKLNLARKQVEDATKALGTKGNALLDSMLKGVDILDTEFIRSLGADAQLPKFKERVRAIMEAMALGNKNGKELNDFLKSKGLGFYDDFDAKVFSQSDDYRDTVRKVMANKERIEAAEDEALPAPYNTEPLGEQSAEFHNEMRMGSDKLLPVIEALSEHQDESGVEIWEVTLAKELLTHHYEALSEVLFANKNSSSPNDFDYYMPSEHRVYVSADGVSSYAASRQKMRTILHETLHALTSRKLKDPAYAHVRAELDSMRQKVLDSLPADERAAVQNAIDKGYYSQRAKGLIKSIPYEGLTTEQVSKNRGIYYALLNVDEFVAQMFSHKSLQVLAKSIKTGPKETWWTSFTKTVRAIFGQSNVPDSVFEATLEQVNKLAIPAWGKHAESLGYVAEQLFKGQGSAPIEVGAKTSTLQTILSYKFNGATAFSVVKDTWMGLIKSTGSYEHKEGRLYLDSRNFADWDALYKELTGEDPTVKSFSADRLPFFFDGLGKRVFEDKSFDIAGWVKNLPEELSALVTGLSKFSSDIADAGMKLSKLDGVEGYGFGIKESAGDMAELHAISAKFLAVDNAIKRDQQEFVGVANTQPEGYRTLQDAAVNGEAGSRDSALLAPEESADYSDLEQEFNKALGTAKLDGVKPTLWEKTMAGAFQLGETYPELRGVLWQAMRHQADLREFMTHVMLPFGGRMNDKGQFEISSDSLKRNERVFESQELTDHVDDILRWQNKESKAFDPSKPTGKVLVAGLSAEQIKDVTAVVASVTSSTKRVQESFVKNEKLVSQRYLGTVIQSNMPTLKVAQTSELARVIYESIELMSDPTQFVAAQAQLVSAQARMTPEAYAAATRYAGAELQRTAEFTQFYQGRSWFTTEQNMNKNILFYRDSNGKRARYGADSIEQIQRKRAEIESSGGQVIQFIEKGDKNHGIDGSLVNKIEEMNQRRVENIKSILPADEFAKISSHLLVENDLRQSMMADRLIVPGAKRKLAGGREDIPMLENHMRYLGAVGHYMATRLTRANTAFELMDPAVRVNPELSNLAQQHINNFLSKDSNIGNAITKANFVYYMGFNLSTNMMELAQSMFSHAAVLNFEGAGVAGSYKLLGNAAKLITQWGVTGKWSNPEHAELMRRSAERDDLKMGSLAEVFDDSSQSVFDMRNFVAGKKVTTKWDSLKKPLAFYGHAAISLYSHFPRFNARLALLSSFDHFRAQGHDFESAFQNAERVNHVANFSGGRAARAVGAFDTKNLPRSFSQAFMSLQSYQTGMISMMGRYIKQGFGKNARGLTPAQVSAAKKSAIMMLGTQMVAAGALGMPGVGAAVGLLNQLFPEMEVNKNIKGFLSSLGGDDDELGHLISDVAMHGAVNQMGAVDLGSRFSLGNNLLGVSSYDGFALENIAGPTAGLLKNMALGIQSLGAGQPGQAMANLIPPGFRKALALAQGGGKIVDPASNMTMDPTTAEQFAMTVGFTPKRLADFKEQSRMQTQSDLNAKKTRERFHDEVTGKFMDGDVQGARNRIGKEMSEDPTLNPQATIAAVASSVEKRTFPADLNRKGSTLGSTEREKISQLFPQTQTNQSTEIQRLQLRKHVMGQLLPGAGQLQPHEIMAAQQVDALMASNPNLQLSEARRQVALMLSHSPQVGASEFQSP